MRNCLLGTLLTGMLLMPAIAGTGPTISRENIVYSARDWQDLRRAFRQFNGKVDGVVAGAFVDKVSQLLDERWQFVGELNLLTKRDRQFRDFVLSNLNEAMPAERAHRIKLRAEQSCPVDASALCLEIANRL